MTRDAELMAALLCERIIIRMNNAFDRGEPATGLALMAETVEWARPEGTLVGRDAIAGFYAARPANVVICHVITNLQVDFPTPDRAICRYYSLGFREVSGPDPAQPAQMPLPMNGAGVLWRYHDSLARNDGAWLVTARRADRIYEKPL